FRGPRRISRLLGRRLAGRDGRGHVLPHVSLPSGNRALRILPIALLAAMTAGCSLYELVLRRSAVDWSGLGIRTVSVVPVIPPTASASASESASVSESVTVTATATLSATANLPQRTRDAAELLAFALRQSAVEVAPEAPDVPRLEVVVKDISIA